MYQIIFYTTLFIGIAPLVVLFTKKRAFDKTHPIVPFIWLTAIATLYEFTGTGLLKINTNYWFQFYSLFEFLTLFYFFYRLSEYIYTLIYRTLMLLFVASYLISLFVWSDTDKLISMTINKIFMSCFIFIAVYLWFKSLFKNVEILNLWKHDNFYFVSAFFIYYFATFLLFLFGNVVFDISIYVTDYWLVNVIATLILRILLITGIWNMKKPLR
ncbi:MAG: hypothetical protein WCY89_06370 [Flavobacteriaceae bacterium]